MTFYIHHKLKAAKDFEQSVDGEGPTSQNNKQAEKQKLNLNKEKLTEHQNKQLTVTSD